MGEDDRITIIKELDHKIVSNHSMKQYLNDEGRI